MKSIHKPVPVLTGKLLDLLAGTCMLAFTAMHTPVYGEDQPVFKVAQAVFNLDERLLKLEADIQIKLPVYIIRAINQGFAVPFMFQVEILAAVDYWFDDKIVSLKQQYQLNYLPMLRSYVVFDGNAGQRYYFNSLDEAVDYFKWVYNYPMLDIDNLRADREFYARIRFGIDNEKLPVPLKSSSLWDQDWDIQSDWYNWKISRSQP